MARTDYRALLAPWLVQGVIGIHGDEKGYCPVHEDPITSKSPSASFNFEKKVWNCHGCGQGGSLASLKKLLDTGELHRPPQPEPERNSGDFLHPSSRQRRQRKPLPSDEDVARWHTVVWDRVEFLRTKRGLNDDTIRKFQLGWDGERYTIPIYDQGKLINVRRYKPNAPAKDKMLNWPGSSPSLYVCGDLAAVDRVVVCEGEFDAMLLHQATGAVTATGTGGAPTWRQAWSDQIAGRIVHLVYDCDLAGHHGANKAAASLAPTAVAVWLVDLGLDNGGDITDWIMGHRELPSDQMLEELRGLFKSAERYWLLEDDEDELARPELGEDAHYGLVGDIVRVLDPATEADPNGVLLTLLVALGNKLGLGTYAEAGAERHPGRLYGLLVGDTARARKGTAWAVARAALRLLDPEWVRGFAKGMSTGEGLLMAFAEGQGSQSEVKMDLGWGVPEFDDLTSTSQNLLVFEAEFARMLTAASREGNTLSAVQRELYDSDSARIMTKKEPLFVSGANLSILGHITYDELKSRLSNVDMASGFANRYLFFFVRRNKQLPHGRRIDYEALDELVVKLQKNMATAGGYLERTAEADKVWEAAYYRWNEETYSGMLDHLTARAATHALRLSVIYAALDGAGDIRPEHVRAAIAVVDYHVASVTYLYGAGLETELKEELYAVIRKAGETGLTKTQQARALGGHHTATELQQARAALVKEGRIAVVKIPTSGRAREVARVVKK